MATAPAKKASREDWHRADIKAALEKKGWTLRALGEHHGVTTLSHTFDRSYPINERRIADAIGVPVQEIWPSRYFPDGRPRQRGIRRTRLTIQSTPAHCQHNGKTQQVA